MERGKEKEKKGEKRHYNCETQSKGWQKDPSPRLLLLGKLRWHFPAFRNTEWLANMGQGNPSVGNMELLCPALVALSLPLPLFLYFYIM